MKYERTNTKTEKQNGSKAQRADERRLSYDELLAMPCPAWWTRAVPKRITKA